MTFATLQAFEVFRLLTILRLLDDFLTDLPTAPLLPPSTSSYLTITLAALVDESVDALVLSLEVSVYYHDHHHYRHHYRHHHQPRLRPSRNLL